MPRGLPGACASPLTGSPCAGHRRRHCVTANGMSSASLWLLALQFISGVTSAAGLSVKSSGMAAAPGPAPAPAFFAPGPAPFPGLPPGLTAAIDASLVKATDAAKAAWAISKQVEDSSEEILKSGNTIGAQVELAKSAAETAKEEDEKATKLFYKTRASAIQAAVFASREYYEKIKAEASTASKNMKQTLKKAAAEAEVKAAHAAGLAAMPYQEQLLRGQKVIVDYQRKAQALAVASNNLKAESSKLAFSASQYQMIGQGIRARQMMMQAHSLFDESENMRKEALRLNEVATKLYGGLPAYQQAEQAAATSAATSANPATSDLLEPFYPY
mmetsp:Transcript_75173/g.141797  ORF Transcript_75173/g.141797 Transcript_75173/m.141797 type:complete len:330 (+) Transcript_75173:85-1074(+)